MRIAIALLMGVVLACGCNCGGPCTADGDCLPNQRCAMGGCVEGPPAGGNDAGQAVDAGGDAGALDASVRDDAGSPDASVRDDAGSPDASVDGGAEGLDASVPDAGCAANEPVELTCDDGQDNDCDGLVDCLDPGCERSTCACDGGSCPPTAWSPCADTADAGVCSGTQSRLAPTCASTLSCQLRVETRSCSLSGTRCGPTTVFGACSRGASTTACTGTQSRQVGACDLGSCRQATQTQACNLPSGLACGATSCCGAGQADYGRCFGINGNPGPHCGSELQDRRCNGSGACATVCSAVVCWATGCGTGGEIGRVTCPL